MSELVWTECDRCGGHGTYAIGVLNGQRWISPVDQGICYKCHGTGKVQVRRRTAEENAGANERNALRRARKQAEKEAEELRREAERPQREAQRLEKSLNSCHSNNNRQCGTCQHRAYCSLLSEAIEAFQNVEANEFMKGILSIDRNATVWENVEIVTTEGEPCRTSRWFEDRLGNRKRCITKPNGEKVYTSSETDKGLARYGLKRYKGM